MTCAGISEPGCGRRSSSARSEIDSVIGSRISDEYAATRSSAPSSSRMFWSNFDAIMSRTSSGTSMPSRFAFSCRMAMRVSRSGGCTSTHRPHRNRLRSRSSIPDSSFGARSDAMTICRSLPCSALNVWKNSVWVSSRFARNWMSSTSSTSTSRYRRWNW